MLLQVYNNCSICLQRFWDGNAIIDLAGGSSVFFASGVRLFRQQRGKSFPLRHDAAGFCGDETRRHYGI